MVVFYQKFLLELINVCIIWKLMAMIIKDLNPNKVFYQNDRSAPGNTLVTPLLIIFETALETGIYPKSWKYFLICLKHLIKFGTKDFFTN